MTGSVAVAAVAAACYQRLPSVAAIGTLRRAVLPGIAGRSHRHHVALTFDDGPDPASTPAFLDELARLGVTATFFVLGTRLVRYPELGRRIVAAGHELAVHGWAHRPHVLRRPTAIADDLWRCRSAVAGLTGCRPRFWRPPHGIPTTAGLRAARTLGLRPVLWTSDGRDWRSDATGDSVRSRIRGHLAPGGVVLLHDSDSCSAPGAWRSALAALPGVVADCRRAGWSIGPLAEHGL